MPKYFFNFFASIIKESLAPITAPIIPDIITTTAVFISIFLFFKFIKIETIQVGIKNIKFAPCAICCSTFENAVNRYMKTAPPPHS